MLTMVLPHLCARPGYPGSHSDVSDDRGQDLELLPCLRKIRLLCFPISNLRNYIS